MFTYFGLFQIYDPHRFFGGINQAWSLCDRDQLLPVLPLYAWAIRRVATASPRSRRRLRVEIVGLVVLYATSIVWRVGWYLYDPYWQRYDVRRPRTCSRHRTPRSRRSTGCPSYLDLFAMGMGLALASAWT